MIVNTEDIKGKLNQNMTLSHNLLLKYYRSLYL